LAVPRRQASGCHFSAKQFLSTLDTEADQFTFQLFIDNKNSSGGNPRIMNVELGIDRAKITNA